MVTKRCFYGMCKNDSRYPNRPSMKGVFFIKFPNPRNEPHRFQQWMIKAGREMELSHDFVETQYKCWRDGNRYVCSKHFEGEKGPTEQNEEPIQCTLKIHRNGNMRSIYTGSQSPIITSVTSMALMEKKLETKINAPIKYIQIREVAGIPLNKHGTWFIRSPDTPTTLQTSPPKLVTLPTSSVPDQAKCPNLIIQPVPSTVIESLDDVKKFLLLATNWCITSTTKNELAISKIKGNFLEMNVKINKDRVPVVYVLGKELIESRHKFSELFPKKIVTVADLRRMYKLFLTWRVCIGNADERFAVLNRRLSKNGYFEVMTNAIHSSKCEKLTNAQGQRCIYCQKYRSSLRKQITRPIPDKVDKKFQTKSKTILQRHYANIFKARQNKRGLPKMNLPFKDRYIEEQIKALNSLTKSPINNKRGLTKFRTVTEAKSVKGKLVFTKRIVKYSCDLIKELHGS